MIKTCMDNVREKAPLVHNITNYVTVNDVANVLLACGGSPIMSDEPDDVEDITSICVGLNINIGTLNKRTIESMFLAGKKSKALGHVLLLSHQAHCRMQLQHLSPPVQIKVLWPLPDVLLSAASLHQGACHSSENTRQIPLQQHPAAPQAPGSPARSLQDLQPRNIGETSRRTCPDRSPS